LHRRKLLQIGNRAALAGGLLAAALCFPGGVGAAKRASPACRPPYFATSPWNTPIGGWPAIDPLSASHVGTLGSALSSDPTQYTYPVYYVSAGAPLQTVQISGTYSDVTRGGRRLRLRGGATLHLRIPAGAGPSAGTDAQLIVINRATGDEWGFWQISLQAGGRWTAQNGYHYNVNWSGVPPRDGDGNPFGSRGAGVTYLAGLVRPCEIAQGHIDHALALAYPTPTSRFVYPASKSDGGGGSPADMPEGARLQLDPSLSAGRLRGLGCRGACLIIARAMQTYGMYIIDNSGHAKIMLEDNRTAHWHGRVSESTVSAIPVSALRVVRPPAR
jgi:hypothetical protein